MKNFENVAGLALANLTAGQEVSTKGYYAAGDGGGATYLIVAPTTADEFGDHTLANTNVALLQVGLSVNIKHFGAVGDGVTDDYPAINAAYESLPVSGGTIKIPMTETNKWVISQTLDIRKKIRLTGQISLGVADAQGTEFIFPVDVAGIVLNAGNTSLYTTVPTDPLTPGASGSVVEYIKFLGTGGTANVDGVVIRAQAELNRVQTRGFARNGIRINADIGGGTDLEGNANSWVLHSCAVISNGADGLYVNGNDANVGVATKLHAQSNGGWGVTDTSLIGSTYVGTDFAANTSGPFNVTSRSTLIGSWEDGGGLSELGSNVTSIGSNGAAPSLTSLGFHQNQGVARHAPYRYTNIRNVVTHSASLGDTSADTACITWGSRTESSGENAWKLTLLEPDGAWVIEFANSSSFRPIYFVNSASALWTDKSFSGPVFGQGYAVTPSTQVSTALTRTLGTVAPVSGTYKIGDIVYNSSPTAGGFIGWACVTAGTPGTWKTFGAISV